MTLKEAKPGMVVKVESIEASELKERLMSMGMVKGTKSKGIAFSATWRPDCDIYSFF